MDEILSGMIWTFVMLVFCCGLDIFVETCCNKLKISHEDSKLRFVLKWIVGFLVLCLVTYIIGTIRLKNMQ